MCLTYVQYYIYKRRGIEMFSLLCVCVCVFVFLFVCLGGLFVCVECVCVCFSVCVFVFLISSVYVFDALFDFLLSTVFIFCLFSFCVCMLFCFQFSLPITKYFVCLLLITGCFCLRSRIFIRLNKSAFFCFVLWVIHVCVCLVDGVFFYDPLRTRCCVHCLWFLFCCVCVGVVYSFSLI